MRAFGPSLEHEERTKIERKIVDNKNLYIKTPLINTVRVNHNMKISTSQFKNGLKIIINDQPCSILEHEFHKPGKGQAVMRVKFRNLITGKVVDKTYKSGESVEEADIMTLEMSYLYSDGEQWHFMNSSTYEQIGINRNIVGDAKKMDYWSGKLRSGNLE